MATDPRPVSEHDQPVKSLKTTIRILEAVESLDEPGVTDIADELDVAKSTVFDHLKTLESNEFVVKTDGNSYRIGLRFLDFGGRVRSELELYRIAEEEVAKLADETGELVNLVVEEHGLGVYIDYVRGADAINLDTYVGKREHLHNTAFGKAMLAYMPESRVDEILERHGLPPETGKTVTSRSELEDRLDRVKERGFAVDREERLDGLRCVAAPIMGEGSSVLGAVSLSGPTSRLQDDRLMNELADEVKRTANIIEINLTYS